jgi:hypothetical protein
MWTARTRLNWYDFFIATGKRAWLADQLGPYLNQVLGNAAERAGVNFVHNSASALHNHEVCAATDPQANGALPGYTVPVQGYGPASQESFHPNAAGQKSMYEALKTLNITPARFSVATATQS